MKLLKCLYSKQTGRNLPIFDIKEENLRDYTTTETNKKQSICKYPPEDFRNYGEDLIPNGEMMSQPNQNVVEAPSEMINYYSKQEMEELEARMEGVMVNPQDEANYSSKYDEEEEDSEARMVGETASGLVDEPTPDGKQDTPEGPLEDFVLLKLIRKNHFGKEFKVQHKQTGKYYTMKCIRKDLIIINKDLDAMKLEKEILCEKNHPFIVGMDYFFSDETRVYFLMDFVGGGDLFWHQVKIRRFSHDQAQFMIAQVAIALGHLHEKNIIYRNLEPENILFNSDGYLMLNDFFLSSKVKNNELARSFCGTAEYLAPEMLTGEGHNQTLDWWMLGILLYEMLVGIPPFFDKNKHLMYRSIKKSKVQYPLKERHNIEVLPVAQDFIN